MAPHAGLGSTAARGAVSTAASQAARVLLQIVSVAVLARLLLPVDYGLVAMALTVIGFGHMFRDMGLFAAAIRAPELSRVHRDNLFWINTGLGLVLAVLCAASGPLLTQAYGHSELTGIAIGLAPTFLIAGAATQFRVSLVRDLKFGLVAGIDLLSNVMGVIVAIVAAAMGLDYWALVLQQVVGGLAFLVGVAWAAGWVPGRFRRHTNIRPILRLGGSVMLSGLLTYVANNIDTITVGVRFGATATGLYNRGVQLVRTSLKQFEGPIGAVSLPVMSKLQHDDVRTIEFARRVQMSVNYPVLLAVAVVAAVPVDVVRIGLGDTWVSSAPVVAFIAIGTGFQVIGDLAGMLLVARGLSGPLARLSVLTALLTIAGVVAGSFFGLTAVAAGYALATALVWPVSLSALRTSAGLPVRPLVTNAGRTVLVATLASLSARGVVTLMSSSSFLRFAVACAVVSAFVALCAAVVPPVRRDLRDLWEMGIAGLRRPRAVEPAPEDTPATS